MSTSPPPSPLLSLDAAVAAHGHDEGVAAHYGNPLREQRELDAGRAIVDLSHISVITVAGPDRLTFLNALSSQKLASLPPGRSAETLFLDAQGRIEYAVGILDDGETSYLFLHPHYAETFVSWLDRMRFTLRVDIRDATEQFAVVGFMSEKEPPHTEIGKIEETAVRGSDSVPLVWHDPWATVAEGGYQYARAGEGGYQYADSHTETHHTDSGNSSHPAAQWHWTKILIERSQLSEIVTRLTQKNLSVAGILAFEALRIAAWRPRFPNEVDNKTLPHELDWLRSAVHLTKGCYRGQETVAKVHNIGHPPRRLVMLHLDGSESTLPVHADTVSRLDGDGAPHPVGHVTSAAMHYELGPIALALIKRTTDPSSTLTVMSNTTAIAATQEIIVPPDAGAVANIPRLQRLPPPTQ